MSNAGCTPRSSTKRSASDTGPCSTAARWAPGSLIGMGAMVLNNAVIGEGSLVAAGAVVREGFEVPPRSLVAGVPAVVKRRAHRCRGRPRQEDRKQLCRVQEQLPRAGPRAARRRDRRKGAIHDPQGQGNPRHPAARNTAVERGRSRPHCGSSGASVTPRSGCPSSNPPSSLSGPSARAPTSSPRRCTPSPTARVDR